MQSVRTVVFLLVIAAPLAAQTSATTGSTAAVASPAPATSSTASTATKPQPRPAAKAPGFQSLRYEERWPASATTHGAARLKHIPLAGDRLHLTLGGQLRARGERVSHYLSESGSGRTDDYGSQRLLLSADLWAFERVRLFAEGRDAFGYDRDLPGGRRTSDHDRWDTQNLFAEARLGAATRGAWARAGRQEIILGRERLVGPSDWGNARRTFDGYRGGAAAHGFALDVFRVRPVLVRSTAHNLADEHTVFSGATLGGRVARVSAWQTYALLLEQDSVAFAGTSGRHRRVTLGGRAEGSMPSPRALPVTWEVEGAAQRGSLGARDVRAWFGASELTAKAARVAWTPAFSIGADASSGDADATDGVSGTFHQLFPSAHSHGGAMDVIGRQNTTELRAALAASPVPAFALRAEARHFDRTSTADAAYAKTGAALRAAGASRSRALGTELDLTGSWQAGRHLKLLAGVGHFAPGRFFRETTAGAHPIDWGFVGTTATF